MVDYVIPKPFSHNINMPESTSWRESGRWFAAKITLGVVWLFFLSAVIAEFAAPHITIDQERRWFGGSWTTVVGTESFFTDALKRSLDDRLAQTSTGVSVPSFRLYDSPQPNAFAMLGWYIVLTRQLITEVETVEELAFILFHEQSHVDRRHVMRGLLRILPISFLFSFVGQIDVEPLVQIGNMMFSRRYEKEADIDAIMMMREVWRNPVCAAGFFERDEGGAWDSWFVWLSTHPSSVSRTELLQSADTWQPCTPLPEEWRRADAIVF